MIISMFLGKCGAILMLLKAGGRHALLVHGTYLSQDAESPVMVQEAKRAEAEVKFIRELKVEKHLRKQAVRLRFLSFGGWANCTAQKIHDRELAESKLRGVRWAHQVQAHCCNPFQGVGGGTSKCPCWVSVVAVCIDIHVRKLLVQSQTTSRVFGAWREYLLQKRSRIEVWQHKAGFESPLEVHVFDIFACLPKSICKLWLKEGIAVVEDILQATKMSHTPFVCAGKQHRQSSSCEGGLQASLHGLEEYC